MIQLAIFIKYWKSNFTTFIEFIFSASFSSSHPLLQEQLGTSISSTTFKFPFGFRSGKYQLLCIVNKEDIVSPNIICGHFAVSYQLNRIKLQISEILKTLEDDCFEYHGKYNRQVGSFGEVIGRG
ncbi:Hypothetical_protein [Hexamita inflata]|uniref:Hypothetical_protein n=1 Tax=Hexamita inflata TaxID=28002 RepID=A0AA86QU05_9EUKA|nr:Hypothetical protein HINF_LOCUS53676 [Hexamita inflata]